MFEKTLPGGYTEVMEGVHLKTLVYGQRTLMVEVKLEKGAVIPLHQHLYEQTGYMVSGHMDFLVAGVHKFTEPGYSWSIAQDTEHGATALEDSVVIEVFSPVREDYLPYYNSPK